MGRQHKKEAIHDEDKGHEERGREGHPSFGLPATRDYELVPATRNYQLSITISSPHS